MIQQISDMSLLKKINTHLSNRERIVASDNLSDLIENVEKDGKVYRMEWTETKRFCTNVNRDHLLDFAKGVGAITAEEWWEQLSEHGKRWYLKLSQPREE